MIFCAVFQRGETGDVFEVRPEGLLIGVADSVHDFCNLFVPRLQLAFRPLHPDPAKITGRGIPGSLDETPVEAATAQRKSCLVAGRSGQAGRRRCK